MCLRFTGKMIEKNTELSLSNGLKPATHEKQRMPISNRLRPIKNLERDRYANGWSDNYDHSTNAVKYFLRNFSHETLVVVFVVDVQHAMLLQDLHTGAPSSHLHTCRDHSTSLYHVSPRVVICLTTCFTGIRSLKPSSKMRLLLSNATDRPLDTPLVCSLKAHACAQDVLQQVLAFLRSWQRPVGPIRAVVDSGKL